MAVKRIKGLHFGALKGGVGKTTININVAVALAVKGKKVLIMDFDPQASATQTLRKSLEQTKGIKGTADWLYKDEEQTEQSKNDLRKKIKASILESCIPNVDFVPAYTKLETVGRSLTELKQRDKILAANISVFGESEGLLDKYDIVIFDLNPAFDLIAENVYMVCAYRGGVIQIVNDDPYSFGGVIKNIKNWEINFSNQNEFSQATPNPFKAILINKAKNSATLKKLLQSIENNPKGENIKKMLLNTIIMDSAIIKNSINTLIDKNTEMSKQKWMAMDKRSDNWKLPKWIQNDPIISQRTPEGNQINNLVKELENKKII